MIKNFNISKVTNMKNMFENCCNLNELNISNFDCKNVNEIDDMFLGCKNLQKLIMPVKVSSLDKENK